MTGMEQLVPSRSAPPELSTPSCPAQAATLDAPGTQDRLVRDLRSGLEIWLTDIADRAQVTVLGEIDLDCAPLLERILIETLPDAQGGLEIDLHGVGFVDCSCLNALLRVRQEAVTSGIPLKVTRMTLPARRLFDLTGCTALFA